MSIELNRCVIGDCRTTLATLPEQTFACCVTSPPYWNLRDYGHPDQLGLESTPEEYVERMVEVFAQVRRVLRDDGTLFLNLGDSYAGKQLVGIPWRVALALQADRWWLRSDIIWHKLDAMPEPVTDRPTKAHEHVFLFAKNSAYFYDTLAIGEPLQAPHVRYRTSTNIQGNGENGNGARFGSPNDKRHARSVWSIATQPYDGAHFATMPPKLAERCILAGCPLGGAVLDPFFGSGTTGQVAEQLGRQWLGCELNPAYGKLAATRTAQSGLRFGQEEPA